MPIFIVYSTVYLFEMLIAYVVFLFVSKRKLNTCMTLLIGFLLFEAGAVINFAGANSILINSVYTVSSTFIFAMLCFDIELKAAAIYVILMSIFSVAFEFATIFAVSVLANTELTEYNNSLPLLLLEASISKTLYLTACILLIYFPQKRVRIEKMPGSFYLFPICILTVIISFWYICARDNISDLSQLILSVTSVILLAATVLLFINYRHSVEQESENLRIKSENERLQTEKAYYDILEHQNHRLMLYAHDAKKHLTAIRNLSSDAMINEYIEKLSAQLGAYANTCHSGNKTLDVIINKYAAECDIHSIKFEYDVKPCNLKNVDSMDLVSILGNLLDNAFTATEKAEKPFISFETTWRNDYSVIVIANSCDEEPISHGAHLITTKKEHKLHGFGLKSVRETLKKYSGDLNWEYNSAEHLFTMTVMLGS